MWPVSLIAAFIAALLLPGAALADDISVPIVEYDISEWESLWQEANEASGGIAGNMTVADIIRNMRNGEDGTLPDAGNIASALKNGLLSRLKRLMAVVATALFSAAAAMAVGNGETGRMLSFCLAGLCMALIAAEVYSVLNDARETIDGISRVNEAVSPALTVIIAACGAGSAASVQPTAILLCSAMTGAFRDSFMPFMLMMCALSAAGVICESKQLKAISGLIKSLLKWGMGLSFTFFLSSVSIKSLNAAGLDSAGTKALRYAFDKSIPVVGGVISGTYEGLRAGAVVLKNAAGTAALLLLLLYFFAPGIRMLCTVLAMRIAAAVCAAAEDGRISNMLTVAAEGCTYMFAASAIAVLMNMLSVAAALLAAGVG